MNWSSRVSRWPKPHDLFPGDVVRACFYNKGTSLFATARANWSTTSAWVMILKARNDDGMFLVLAATPTPQIVLIRDLDISSASYYGNAPLLIRDGVSSPDMTVAQSPGQAGPGVTASLDGV